MTTPTEPEALAAVLDAVIMSAQHDMARTQTDFLGRMGQSLCEYQDIFEQHPDGDLGAEVREDADEAILSLAGLALAQLLMLRGFNHRDAVALSAPAARMLAEGFEISTEGASQTTVLKRHGTPIARFYAGRFDATLLQLIRQALNAHPPAAEPVGLRATDLQLLVRKIYDAEGLDRTKSTQAERHAAQRLYDITRTNTQYVAHRQALATPARTDDAGVGGL